MTGPRASIPATYADHPLRAALAAGDGLYLRSIPALKHMLFTGGSPLVGEAVIAQVGGLLSDIARQLAEAHEAATGQAGGEAALAARLADSPALVSHCHALALEWRLVLRLESDLALDPVLSALLQTLVGEGEPDRGALAMRVLAAQTRFAQSQRRMQLPLAELPAELFHEALLTLRKVSGAAVEDADAHLRASYGEGEGRLALLGRLVDQLDASEWPVLDVEKAGLALWLSALALRAGQARDRVAVASSDPQLGRLLLTLRAAGAAPSEAERQAVTVQPDCALPRGLHEIGTREAAQWLAEARP